MNAVDACKLVTLAHLKRLGNGALVHLIADSAFAFEALYVHFNMLHRSFPGFSYTLSTANSWDQDILRHKLRHNHFRIMQRPLCDDSYLTVSIFSQHHNGKTHFVYRISTAFDGPPGSPPAIAEASHLAYHTWSALHKGLKGQTLVAEESDGNELLWIPTLLPLRNCTF